MNEVLYMDKGRVTIPKDCRTRRGLEDGDTLLFWKPNPARWCCGP